MKREAAARRLHVKQPVDFSLRTLRASDTDVTRAVCLIPEGEEAADGGEKGVACFSGARDNSAKQSATRGQKHKKKKKEKMDKSRQIYSTLGTHLTHSSVSHTFGT